ncbi:hypothetical protein KEM55_009082 [Ascosphaera atra]|nr:hypothetical protein KEM55_009082 [Ascosphaera atra]
MIGTKEASPRKWKADPSVFQAGVAAMRGHRYVRLPAGAREWGEEEWVAFSEELEVATRVAGICRAAFEEERARKKADPWAI